MFHYTVETTKSMEEAIKTLEEELKKESFGILWQFDLTSKLQEKGLSFDQPYQILEVCNPKEAQKVITANPMVGYFLPCKIVVYHEQGKVKIGMPKPTVLIDMVEGEELSNIAKDIEERLIACIDRSK